MKYQADEKVWGAILAAEPALAALFSRQPAYRYWTDPRGYRYCWTTERMSDGKYAAFTYRPVGKGSRSGKATRFKLAREVHFRTRRAAKQRAADWFNKANANV